MQQGSTLVVMFAVWGVITAAFVVLMIYRSLVAMREEDQLFIDPAESKLEEAQRQVVARLDRITPFTKLFGWASGLLLLSIAAVWIYLGLTASNPPFSQ